MLLWPQREGVETRRTHARHARMHAPWGSPRRNGPRDVRRSSSLPPTCSRTRPRCRRTLLPPLPERCRLPASDLRGEKRDKRGADKRAASQSRSRLLCVAGISAAGAMSEILTCPTAELRRTHRSTFAAKVRKQAGARRIAVRVPPPPPSRATASFGFRIADFSGRSGGVNGFKLRATTSVR